MRPKLDNLPVGRLSTLHISVRNQMLSRRQLGLMTAVGAVSACASSLKASPPVDHARTRLPESPRNAITLDAAAWSAYVFGLPLIENAVARKRHIDAGSLNAFFHNRTRANWQTQTVTAPNNDCLMSRAWLDLSKGGATIVLPRTGDRYFSLALMDMYTNNFAVLGSRTTGEDGGVFRIVGPGQATADPLAIRAPTPWVWALGRTLVDSDDDLPAAHAIQDQLTVSVDRPGSRPPEYATRASSWQDLYASIQALMVENPPYATDARMLLEMSPLGLTVDGRFKAERFDRFSGQLIEQGRARAATDLLAQSRDRAMNGWSYPGTNLGWFDQDYLYRAQVAQVGLAALPPAEATYLRALDETGNQVFRGGGPWQIRFAADNLPPVGAFWSLTLYERAEDGQSWLFDNPIGRNSISSRLPGVRRDPDGSLTFVISRTDPGASNHSNWLPAPREKPFIISLRLYWPDRSIPDGSYKPPRIVELKS